MDYQSLQREFEEKLDRLAPIPEKPVIADDETAIIRITLMNEELKEVMVAILEKNLEHIAKELADLLYVVFGTATRYGIPMDRVFEEVHRSNMTKFPEDGNLVYREDGKLLKPDTYTPANLEGIV
jgi:predicted HAD superfamily Cof-like phosphohydrolase